MDCKHRMKYDTPYEAGGGWTGKGLVCVKCGFQTLTVGTYIPAAKPCHQCGRIFDGMADAPDEVCLECVTANVETWIAETKQCPHERLRRGLCFDCGTGTHGRHQWRWRLLHRLEDLRLRIGV